MTEQTPNQPTPAEQKLLDTMPPELAAKIADIFRPVLTQVPDDSVKADLILATLQTYLVGTFDLSPLGMLSMLQDFTLKCIYGKVQLMEQRARDEAKKLVLKNLIPTTQS